MRRGLTATVVAIVTALVGPATVHASISITGPATTPESGTVTYTVSRSAMPPGVNPDATVVVTATPGTASTPADFTSQSQTLTLPPSLTGSSSTFAVSIAADTLNEPDETFTVELSDSKGDTLAPPSSVTSTILDDDPVPSVTVGTPAAATEGTGTAGPGLIFPVTLSAPSGKSVSVGYTTGDGSASAGQDYTATSGTLTIPAGSSGGTVTVPVTADALDESDESLTLTLSAPSNATLGNPGTATGTIIDDDTALLSISGTTLAEGAPGTTSIANATVDLSTASDHAVSVTYTTVDGTATAPSDYTAATGHVAIPAGQRSAVIPVTIGGDSEVEPDEVLSVRLSDPVGAAIVSGADVASIVITNDDAAPVAPATPTAGPAPAAAAPAPAPSPGGAGATNPFVTSPVAHPPATGGGVAATTAIRLAKPTFSRATGRLRYRVTCPARRGRCRVGLTVFSVPAAKSPVSALHREQQLAARTLTVAAGRTVTVEFRLSKKVRGWLRSAGRIKTNAYAVAKDGSGAYSTASTAATLSR